MALIDVSPKGSEIAEKLASQYGPRVKYFKADVTNSDEFNGKTTINYISVLLFK